MCTNNWPLLLDLSRDECKRILRRLELEAYSAVLTAFRAQGDLSKDKKGILQELQNILSISTERHRAEVRRAVNDEKLTTIADNMAGPDVSSEWQIEGRRLIPLMPRLVPQTAFTVTANNAASMQAEKNLSLPPPSQTGSKEVIPTPPTTPSSAVPAMAPKVGRPTSPASNVVVLPSGMSIHIKGGLNTDEDEVPNKKGRRSSSTEAAVITKTTHAPAPVVVTKPTLASASPTNMSPMKITFTKSPAKQQATNVTQSQKVILVSTTTQAGSSPTIIQKSMAVPVIKTTTTTGGTVTTFTSPRASIIMPSSMGTPSVANGNLGSIVTVSTTSSTGVRTSIPTVTALATANPTLLASSLNAMRPRTKMITTRPKVPMMSPRAGMVMQMGASHMAGSPMAHGSQGIHNIHVKPVHTKPTIHIKHEGGMKIITQGMPTSGSKILPKPPGSGQGSPMVVMSSAQPSITMVSKSNASLAGQVAGGRVLNITTQGGKVIASSSNRGTAANVVTVNPKTLQLTAIKGAGGTTVLTTSGRVATATGAKPNVIVVQKAQPKRFATSTTSTITFPRPSTSATSTANSTMEKKHEVLKHMPQKTIVTKQTMMTKSGMEIKRQPQPYAVRTDGMGGEGGRSSLLAELIQAVGIQPDSSGEVMNTAPGGAVGMDDTDPNSGIHTVVVQQEEVVMTSNPNVVTVPAPTTSKEVGGNRWVEYDVPRGTQTLLHAGRDSSDTSAIKALLDLQTGAKHQPRQKTLTNLDLSQIRIQHQDRYSVGQGALSRAVTSTTPSSNRTLHFTQARTQHVSEPMTTNVVLEQPDGETVAVQLAGADLAQLTSMGQEIIGELDPETGIFYTTAPGGGEEAVTVVTTTHHQVHHQLGQQQQRYIQHHTPVSAVRAAPVTTAPAAKPIDFLSSALSSAQIDLDPYQFIDEDEPAFGTKQTVSDMEPELQQPAEGSLMQILTPDSSMPVATEESVESQELNLDSLAGVEPSSAEGTLRLTTHSVHQDITLGAASTTVSLQSAAQGPSQVLPTHTQHTQGSLQTRPSPVQTIRVTTVPTPRSVMSTVQTTAQTVMSTTAHTTRPTISTAVPSVVSAVQTMRPVVSPVVSVPATIAPEQASKAIVSTIQQPTQPLVSTVQLTSPMVPAEPSNRTVTSSIPTFQAAPATATSTVQVMQSIVSTVQSTAQTTTQANVPTGATTTLQAAASIADIPIIETLPLIIPTIETAPLIIPTIETALPTVSTLVPTVSDEVPSSTTEGAPVDEGTLLQQDSGEILEEMVVSDGIIDFEQHEVCVPDTASNVTVAVEPGGLDTTTMVIEDFTSQQYITDTTEAAQSSQGGELITIEYSSQGEGSHLDDLGPGSPPGMNEGQSSSGESGDPGVSPVRASSRKRRPPSMPDDSPPHGHGNMSSWVRHASSLLQKVCKYRGSRKEKGELNASAWFLAPVDPKEVPDYYEIIKQPMDFGTIRHKLETSQYNGWDDFHTDMLLVQENCRRYNPPGHEIRRDCEEVFSFYTLEYEWGRDKWQKAMTHVVTPKKPRMDRSPMRT